MNRTTAIPRASVPSQRSWKTFHAMAGMLALLSAAPAFSASITFESIVPGGYAVGEAVTEDGFNILVLDGPFGGANGVVMNDAGCDILACPGGASGKFLGILNDGGVNFSMVNGGVPGFQVKGLDFAFLAPTGGLPNFNYGRLQLSGLLADGTTLATSFDFPRQGDDGLYMFGGARFGSVFSSTVFKSLTVNACVFNENLDCTNSLDDPAFYTAQFALDNLQFKVVPEPVSLMLIGLGMGAMALGRRRVVSSKNLQAQGAQA
jgi:hypothetical protein